MHLPSPFLLAVLALGACSKAEEPAPAAGPPTAATAEAPGVPLKALALPNVADCARKCVERNRMRAVGPEQLESDCGKECHTSCVDQCKLEGRDNGPAQLGARCREDCDRQREALGTRR